MTTLMFTDIESSTKLLAGLGARYVEVLRDHRDLIRDSVAVAGGVEVDTQGDSFFVSFTRPDAALAAAISIQQRMREHRWPGAVEVSVRIGIHSGDPAWTGDGYVGLDVHLAARICAAAHGGQIVISEASRDLLRSCPESRLMRPLGAHRLKDLETPVTLFDLNVDGIDVAFPPLRSLGSHPSNLPHFLPPIVGRSALVADSAQRLRAGPRLITLTGTGGIGKTTLSLHVAATLRPLLPDGAFVVWLASVDRSDSVPAAIAQALHLRIRAGQDAAMSVTDYLSGREILIVLDNLEHLLGAAEFIGSLLESAPQLRLIVTSRIRLHLPEEEEIRVPPLAVAVPASDGEDSRVIPAALELFALRSNQPTSTMSQDPALTATVAEICQRLDGVPLAIELVAARTRLLTPADLLSRIQRPLELAAGGPRTAPHRQRTLRATIGWSVDLLNADQKRTFARLAVFSSAFTVEAAERVCSASLDDLAELLEQNLLVSLDEDGPGRLRMLETIKSFASELLVASGDVGEIRDRHAAWCAELAQAGGPELLKGDHEKLLDRFDAEKTDLSAAIDWLTTTDRGVAALEMATDLAVFWDTRGLLREGVDRLQNLLQICSDAADVLRARALFNVGRMSMQMGDLSQAEAALDQALRIFRSAEDPRALTLCLSHIVVCSDLRGDADGAERLCEEALAVARDSRDPWTIAVALNNVASSVLYTDPDRARQLLAECIPIRRAIGERRTLAISLGNLGELLVNAGDLVGARPVLEEALQLAVEVGYEVIVADVRRCLAVVARHQGDLRGAKALLDDALARGARLGDPLLQGLCMIDLERIAVAEDDGSKADHWRSAITQLTAKFGLALPHTH